MVDIDNMHNTKMTITARFTRKFLIRWWIAKRLFILGARVSGMDIEIDESDIADKGHSRKAGE